MCSGRLHAAVGVDPRPDGGVRELIAMPRAKVGSAAVGEASMDQPTTRRA
jgi:hypothetical protein